MPEIFDDRTRAHPRDEVTFDVEHRTEVTVVRIAGALTVRTAPAVHTRLLKCLAEYPTALIIEVAGVAAESDVPLTVFRAVQRQAHRWPGIPMLLCRPNAALAERLARPGPGYPPIYPTIDRAIAALDQPVQVRPTIHADLLAAADACAHARDIVFQVCQDWDLTDAADAAEVIVSELVGNAVRHARPPLRLLLAVGDGHLHIAVRDGSPRRPQPVVAGTLPAPPVDHGRGLHLVNAIATNWGSMPTAEGKLVWATLRTTP
jgi:anti-anti-sigma regulatory factor